MSRREEREIAREWRRKTIMEAPAKRRCLVELAKEMAVATHRDPVAAVPLLPRIWALRRELNVGCLPIVCR